MPDAFIEKIIRRGANIMLEKDVHRLNIKQKSGTANFVTEYDVRVQRYLENEFSKPIPVCSFLSKMQKKQQPHPRRLYFRHRPY